MERESKGPGERILAAYNLGVAEATAGDLARAEAAFTRALGGLAAGSPHAEQKVETTNSSRVGSLYRGNRVFAIACIGVSGCL